MGRAERIIFMGTPRFAVPSLIALLEGGHRVVLAVTQPDKPRGRGLATVPSPVKEEALSRSIEVFEPHSVKDGKVIERLKSLRPDFIAVVAYGKILPEAVLNIPSGGCINLHASLLPKYRGAAPINWAIINGEKETGVSTMYMDRGMDTGPVLLEQRVPIGDGDTAEDLAVKLSKTGAALLEKTISLLASGAIEPKRQDDSLATYAPVLKKENGRIDWSRTAPEVRNLIRGVYPWPGAYTVWAGRPLKVHGGYPAEKDADETPGTVVDVSGGRITVACGKGVFEITELQPENRKRMRAGDFLKGYRVERGQRFD